MKNIPRLILLGVLAAALIVLLAYLPAHGQADLSGSAVGKAVVVPAIVATVKCNDIDGACASTFSGAVGIRQGNTTVTVSTTTLTASSDIFIGEDASLAPRLGGTCNPSTPSKYWVSSRVPGTSFTVSTNNAPVTNKACLSFTLIN